MSQNVDVVAAAAKYYTKYAPTNEFHEWALGRGAWRQNFIKYALNFMTTT